MTHNVFRFEKFECDFRSIRLIVSENGAFCCEFFQSNICTNIGKLKSWYPTNYKLIRIMKLTNF